MANKLAGQKAKYTKAYADYNRSDDAAEKANAARRMAEVLRDAAGTGFSEAEVTTGRDPSDAVRAMARAGETARLPAEDPEQLIQQLAQMANTLDLLEEGRGDQAVYAYGYRCLPGRLKVGRTERDVIARVTQQINESTPDQPALVLVLRTPDCRALEMALHGALRLRGRKVAGGGAEWFSTDRDELLARHRAISGSPA